MLKTITIEHIKGIQRKVFDLDVLPNKSSLLVAPNGYGKSSLATAFNSMNRNRIVLDEDDYYMESAVNAPTILFGLQTRWTETPAYNSTFAIMAGKVQIQTVVQLINFDRISFW